MTRRRLFQTLAAGLLLVAVLSTCDDNFGGYVEPVPSVIAARADGERLELWAGTGTPCVGVTEIVLTLDRGTPDPLAVVDYVAREPQTLDQFDLRTPPVGFTARAPLPAGVSWRDAEDLSVVITLAGGKRSGSVDLDALADAVDSGDAGPDDYLLGNRLLTEGEVLDGDGDDYALVCSPDPTAD